jgi:hypothetical protein
MPSLFERDKMMQELYLELPATVEQTDIRQLEKSIISDGLLDQSIAEELPELLELELAGRLPRTVKEVTRQKHFIIENICQGIP